MMVRSLESIEHIVLLLCATLSAGVVCCCCLHLSPLLSLLYVTVATQLTMHPAEWPALLLVLNGQLCFEYAC